MDEEKYKEKFKKESDEQIINNFNKEVGNSGWTSSRASFLFALHEELECRFDCSEIIGGGAMSLKSKVKLLGKKIILDK